ncbi:MAG: serine protease [Lachnospiraceae bacterium]|nr:serine protease [Lachnospiraceae bacterium]
MDVFSIIAIVLIVAGFILVGVEMVVPGFSVPGVTGIVCLVVGIFLAADSVKEGVIISLIVIALLAVMMFVLLKVLASGKLKSPIILQEEQANESGYISSGDLQYLLGKEGVALTDLRPSGKGDFDGVSFDVLTDGSYIIKGAKIVIQKVQGSKLIVREIR